MVDKETTIATLDDRAVAAALDNNVAELLIEEFRPFMHGCVARFASGSREDVRDDMFSVAMVAFYEAIRSYDKSKGHFLPFAGGVIRRRLIDNIRRSYRDERTVDIDDIEDEFGEVRQSAVNDISIRNFQAQSRQELLAFEIEQFKNELKTWDLTLADLAKQSPKHTALRETYRMVVDMVAQDADIMQTIQIKRYFPIKKIADLTGVPTKKLERARTFILASLIIATGDYEYMSDYVKKSGG